MIERVDSDQCSPLCRPFERALPNRHAGGVGDPVHHLEVGDHPRGVDEPRRPDRIEKPGASGITVRVIPGQGRVAWRVPAVLVPLAAHFWVWVDAETGAVLRQAPAGKDQTVTRLEVRP